MAWYDNLQRPDYSGYYKQQGDIYSNLLNSLAKIGTGYLESEAKAEAGKKVAELMKGNTSILDIPAVVPTSPPARVSPYRPNNIRPVVPAAGYPSENLARNFQPSGVSIPASTISNFDEQGYIRALSDLLIGGTPYEQEAASRAYSVFKMQNDLEKQRIVDEENRIKAEAGLTRGFTPTEGRESYNKETGKWEVTRPPTPKSKMEIFVDKDGNRKLINTNDPNSIIPSGYMSENSYIRNQIEKNKDIITNKNINQKNIEAALDSLTTLYKNLDTSIYNKKRLGEEVTQEDINSLTNLELQIKELQNRLGGGKGGGKATGSKNLFN